MRDALKPIKTEQDYEVALETMDEVFDALEGTREADIRDVLSVLIEKYEDENHPIDPPDPIEAITFRMEQAGWSQQDLIPLIGSRSKVSEVLSRKRDLSLRMIRALWEHLGIPADVLLGHREPMDLNDLSGVDFSGFPIKEMHANGAFKGLNLDDLNENAEACIRYLISKIGGPQMIPVGLFRKSSSVRLNANLSVPALQGWSLQVLATAKERKLTTEFNKANVDESFLKSLVQLSVLDAGPKIAQEMLEKNGIILVIVNHLKKTYLDGAAFLPQESRPVIGLTLRYDRLDNFWFTLLHEIGHVLMHLSSGTFVADDMTLRGKSTDNEMETEADEFAEKILLPSDFDFEEMKDLTNEEVREYAAKNNIHAAIVAGQLRYKKSNYRAFWNLVGKGEVRKCFANK